jgi:uncharacterized cupredoxin-like copper-binding protein
VSRAFLVGVLTLACGCSSLGTGPRLDIVATEYSYAPANTSIDAHSASFAIHNQGQEEHDFELIGPQGIVTHMEAIQPGITKGISVDLRPGTYRFICTIEDHAQRGMTGTLTVR